jgi:hypothetical protein
MLMRDMFKNEPDLLPFTLGEERHSFFHHQSGIFRACTVNESVAAENKPVEPAFGYDPAQFLGRPGQIDGGLAMQVDCVTRTLNCSAEKLSEPAPYFT